jgi:hypothetical protein
LFVRIKDQRRPGKTARFAGAVGVQADHIKGLPAEAKGKMRVARVGSDVRVPIEMGGIVFVQETKLLPD